MVCLERKQHLTVLIILQCDYACEFNFWDGRSQTIVHVVGSGRIRQRNAHSYSPKYQEHFYSYLIVMQATMYVCVLSFLIDVLQNPEREDEEENKRPIDQCKPPWLELTTLPPHNMPSSILVSYK
jgi:hypothetical protein